MENQLKAPLTGWLLAGMLTLAPAVNATEYQLIDLGPGYAAGLNEKGHTLVVSDGATYYYDGTNITNLGTIGTGTMRGAGLTDNGEVVASYSARRSLYDTDIAYYDGKNWIFLGRFGSEMITPTGINNSGVITGYYKPSGSGNRAFTYNVTSKIFKPLASDYSDAIAINSSGRVVGTTNTVSGLMRPYYYDGTLHEINPIGGAVSSRRGYGYGLNDLGDVVGQSHDGNYKYHAFLYRNGYVTDLGTLGGTTSRARNINTGRTIVGSSLNANGDNRAFVYRAGQMRDLNALTLNNAGWVLSDARYINDAGQIAGTGTYGGVQHAFLLNPVVDLSLRASGPTVVADGSIVSSYFYVNNTSSSEARAVTLKVTLPDSATQVQVYSSVSGTCQANNSEAVCSFPRIAPRGYSWARISLLPGSSHVTVSGVVESLGSEKTPENNHATHSYDVDSAPVLTVFSPTNELQLKEHETLTLRASAIDAEKGDISSAINWSSSKDGPLGTGGTLPVTLSRGVHLISATVSDGRNYVSASATVVVNGAPTITLTAPASGSVVNEGSNVLLKGTASDPEDGDLSSGIEWSSTLDGKLGSGGLLSVALSPGTHTITAKVVDSAGVSATAVVQNVVVNRLPELTIKAPTPGAVIDAGKAFELSANATDAEDGDLGQRIRWSSSIDGSLGTGASLPVVLSSGLHVITATVQDSYGATQTVSVRDILVNTLPTVTLKLPTQVDLLTEDALIAFDATAIDAEDGDISSTIKWTSSIDGAIGTGSRLTSLLSAGTHIISASATDSQGGTAAAIVKLTVDPVPQISLQARSEGNGAKQTAILRWAGARTTVDVYKDGAIVDTGPASGEQAYDYKKSAVFKICESDSHYCSQQITVSRIKAAKSQGHRR